jgi:hypothetical protein
MRVLRSNTANTLPSSDEEKMTVDAVWYGDNNTPDYETLTSKEYALAEEEEKWTADHLWYNIYWKPPQETLPRGRFQYTEGYDWRVRVREHIAEKIKRREEKERQVELGQTCDIKSTTVKAAPTYNFVEHEHTQIPERFISQYAGLAKVKRKTKKRYHVISRPLNKERKWIKNIKAEQNKARSKERRRVAKWEKEEVKRKELLKVGAK